MPLATSRDTPDDENCASQKCDELRNRKPGLSNDAPQRAAAKIPDMHRNSHLASGVAGVDEATVAARRSGHNKTGSLENADRLARRDGR